VRYHAHYANEELLIVLDGVLELRTPDETREVSKGAVVGFPVGVEGPIGCATSPMRPRGIYSFRPCASPKSPSNWIRARSSR
jgi:quercetin dioxygenase-like cupin family protein